MNKGLKIYVLVLGGDSDRYPKEKSTSKNKTSRRPAPGKLFFLMRKKPTKHQDHNNFFPFSCQSLQSEVC